MIRTESDAPTPHARMTCIGVPISVPDEAIEPVFLGRNTPAQSVQHVLVMTIQRHDSSINPIHLVTPDRVIVPMRKSFESPVGVVPFHRMLRAENLANRSEIQPAKQAPIARTPDSFEPSSTGLMPKLGEVLLVEPTKMAPAKIQQTHQVQVPATGQLLDLYL